MGASIASQRVQHRVPADSASYFEAYLGPEGIVVEVYVTEQDFRASRKGRVIPTGGDAESAVRVCRVELFQTVAPYSKQA